jgi:hypothetical protein
MQAEAFRQFGLGPHSAPYLRQRNGPVALRRLEHEVVGPAFGLADDDRLGHRRQTDLARFAGLAASLVSRRWQHLQSALHVDVRPSQPGDFAPASPVRAIMRIASAAAPRMRFCCSMASRVWNRRA